MLGSAEVAVAVAVCLLPAVAVALRYVVGWLWLGQVAGCLTRCGARRLRPHGRVPDVGGAGRGGVAAAWR
jgi:hypothetical protein